MIFHIILVWVSKTMSIFYFLFHAVLILIPVGNYKFDLNHANYDGMCVLSTGTMKCHLWLS